MKDLGDGVGDAVEDVGDAVEDTFDGDDTNTGESGNGQENTSGTADDSSSR